jgi:hypothetical protein
MASFSERVTAFFGGDTTELDRILRSLPDRMKASGEKMSSSFSRAFAGMLSVGGLYATFNKVASFADGIRKTSEAIGVSTDFLQDFSAAARNNGSSTEAAQKGLEKLAAKIGKAQEEGGEAAADFERWGIALYRSNGAARNTEEIAREIADRMADVSAGTRNAAMAIDLMGKGAIDLIPAMRGGSAAIDEFGNSINKLSEEDIKSLDDTKDKIDNFFSNWMVGLGRSFGMVERAWDRIWNNKLNPEEAAKLKTGFLKAFALMPGDLRNTLFDIGGNNSGGPLDINAAKAKRTLDEQLATAKRVKKELEEMAKETEKLSKLQKDSETIGETTTEKRARLLREINELEKTPTFSVQDTVKSERIRVQLQERRNELKRNELEIDKDQAAQAEKRKKAEEDSRKATEAFSKAQIDRHRLTLGELAGEGGIDFDPTAGVRGRSRRRRAERRFNAFVNNVSPEERAARDTAQEIYAAEERSRQLAAMGHFYDAIDMRKYIDDLRGSLPPELAKISEIDPLAAQREAVIETANILRDLQTKGGGTLPVTVANGAQ